MTRLTLITIAALISSGCGGKSKGGADDASGPDRGATTDGASAGAGTTTTADAGTAASAGCDLAALGLGSAKAVPFWQPPAGCEAIGGPAPATIPVASEQEFAVQFTCAGGVTSGIDFARDQIVVQHRHLSPASAGGEVVDDGTTVTFVTHYRHNCPDDPRPMPMEYSATFLIPAGAKRAFADTYCTVGVQPKCK